MGMNLFSIQYKKSPKKTKIIVATIIAGSFIGGAFLFTRVALGQVPLIFGGPILWVDYCTCSGNIRLTVGPPVPGAYVFQPGRSIPFLFYQLYRPGPFVLGNATTGGSCSIYVGDGCATLPTLGTIFMVGTSF